jgi:hypothetical protein
MPRKKPTPAEVYAKYDKRTNKAMAEHNAKGGSVRKPVRDAGSASSNDLYDRAKFGARKAQQAIKLSQPLKDKNGNPTPAAMQFKRWDYPVPKNQADLSKIKRQADAAKARLKPKGK